MTDAEDVLDKVFFGSMLGCPYKILCTDKCRENCSRCKHSQIGSHFEEM